MEREPGVLPLPRPTRRSVLLCVASEFSVDRACGQARVRDDFEVVKDGF